MVRIALLFAVSILCSLAIPSGTLNETDFKEKCRPEDGYYMCSTKPANSDYRCLKRHELGSSSINECNDRLAVSDWKHVPRCNNDEITCRVSKRCIPRKFVKGDLSCLFKNTELHTFQCRKNEFMCEKTRSCLPRYEVADGKVDCNSKSDNDTSDENTTLDCGVNEFKCQSGRCIPREWVKDDVNDCNIKGSTSTDGSDEIKPLPRCLFSEFRCKEDGRCISRFRVWDGFNDCKDGLDERYDMRLICNETIEFSCSNGRCIPRSWVLDGTSNCENGEDEILRNISCTPNEVSCLNGKRCVDSIYLCDGINHCGDCSDEIERCPEPSMIRCPNDETICIPSTFLCDTLDDCPHGVESNLPMHRFKCKMDSRVVGKQAYCAIPQNTLHDDISICGDDSDVCWVDGEFRCSYCLNEEIIISNSQICDGTSDCPDLSDECLCIRENRNNQNNSSNLCNSICYGNDALSENCALCKPGDIYCKEDKKCVKPYEVCDGLFQCPISNIDEKFCGNQNQSYEVEVTYNYTCHDTSYIEALSITFGFHNMFKILNNDKGNTCDGKVECGRFEDECESDCPEPLHPACHRFNLVHETVPKVGILPSQEIKARMCNCSDCFVQLKYITGNSLCNGFAECPDESDEENCTDRFKCDGGDIPWPNGRVNVISVHLSKVCDGVIDCKKDQKDELGCNKSTHFYCKNQQPLFVLNKQKMDGYPDCSDASDECPDEYFVDNPFSSIEELVENAILRYFIWIIAEVSVLGNVFVIITTVLKLCKKTMKSVVKCNKILILNLSISDLLMGIGLNIISVKSYQFSGKYCVNEKPWRASSLCTVTGILVTISSETSVLILVLMTIYRLYSVLNPVQARNINNIKTVLFIILIWVCSFTLAFVPLLEPLSDVMYSAMLTSWTSESININRQIGNDVITLDNLSTFVSRISALGKFSFNNTPHFQSKWKTYTTFLRKYYPNYSPKVLGYFGFYSAHGVCMPRIYKTASHEVLNPLTVVLISINFISMFFIGASYIVIYVKSRARGNILMRDSVSNRNRQLQRKITILVLTDFICWFPICITSFISIAVKPISGTFYAFSAIINLPINSALNPMIYANTLGKIRKTWKRYKPFKRQNTVFEPSTPSSIKNNPLPSRTIRLKTFGK